jgi:hypothetical protein
MHWFDWLFEFHLRRSFFGLLKNIGPIPKADCETNESLEAIS